MDRDGIKKSILLLGSYWQNFKVPTEQKDLDIAVEAWMTLLKTVPNEEVIQEIARMSASGREFAPNVGQIYAAIKERRDKQKAIPETDKLEAYHREIMQPYRDAGLPTPSEAKKQGILFADYQKMCEEAGVCGNAETVQR